MKSFLGTFDLRGGGNFGCAPLVGGIAEDHSVGFVVAALDRDFCAVLGKAELVDAFGSEMGELMGSGAIERLHPKVADTFFVDDIHNGLAVRRKL
jgi:hypothetical protein